MADNPCRMSWRYGFPELALWLPGTGVTASCAQVGLRNSLIYPLYDTEGVFSL
jgi:hypothetical protein